jgi:hypothetical protein
MTSIPVDEPLSVVPPSTPGDLTSFADITDSQVFTRVLENVLCFSQPTHPVFLSIDYNFLYKTITDFTMFDDDPFKTMKYQAPLSGNMQTIAPSMSPLLLKFKHFMMVLYRNNGIQCLTNSEWMDITHEDFVQFIQLPESLTDPDDRTVGTTAPSQSNIQQHVAPVH